MSGVRIRRKASPAGKERKQEAFGGGTGKDRNTLLIAAHKNTAARQKKKEAHNGIFQQRSIALGAGLGIWGAINLLEGYGNDNPGAKSQGMKQLMAGGGVALIGTTLVPLLSGLFG